MGWKRGKRMLKQERGKEGTGSVKTLCSTETGKKREHRISSSEQGERPVAGKPNARI